MIPHQSVDLLDNWISITIGAVTIFIILYKVIIKITKFIKKYIDQMDINQKDLDGIKTSIIDIINTLSSIKESTLDNKDKLHNVISNLSDVSKEIHIVSSQLSSDRKLSNESIFIADNTGKWTDVNPALCRLFGAEKEEILGYGWIRFIIEKDASKAKLEWQEGFKYNELIYSHYDIKHGYSLENISVEYKAAVIKDPDGKIMYVLGKISKIIT